MRNVHNIFICSLAMLMIHCGGSKTSNPPSTPTPTPNPNNGNIYTTPSSYCGPYNANATSSSGAAPPYPGNIIDLVGQTNTSSIDMCSTSDSTSAIGTEVTYVQISSDTLFIWSDSSQRMAMLSSFSATDTAADHDHFEFLGNADVPAILNSGYTLSQTDLSHFFYTYSNPIYLSNSQTEPGVGNFLGKKGYLAFRIYSAQSYLYGWALIQLTPTYELSVYEVVINTTVNTPLGIGQYQ